MAHALNRVLSHSSTHIEENIKNSLKELKDASNKSFTNWLRYNSQIVVDAEGNACDINGCIKHETNPYNMEEHHTGLKTVQFFNNWITVWNTYVESTEKSDADREKISPVFHRFAVFYFSPLTIFATTILTIYMIIIHIIMAVLDYNFISFVYAYAQLVVLIDYILGARLYKGSLFEKLLLDQPADKSVSAIWPYGSSLHGVLELLCCRWCKCKSDNRLPMTGGAGGISLSTRNITGSNSQFGSNVNRISERNRMVNPFLLNDIPVRPSEMSGSVLNPARLSTETTETTETEYREKQVEQRDCMAIKIDKLHYRKELNYYSTIHSAFDYLKYTLPGHAAFDSSTTDKKLSLRLVGVIWTILGILLAYIILSAYLFYEHCTDPNHKSQLLVWDKDQCIRDVVELTASCFYLLYPIQGFFLYGGFTVVMIG